MRDKEKDRAAKRKRYYAERQELLNAYGAHCDCCGEEEPTFLCIDHIYGGGTQHRKEVGSRMERILKQQGYPAGYRVLCYNCNHAVTRGPCPHKIAAGGLVTTGVS